MSKNAKGESEEQILGRLKEDPTTSAKQMAEELNITRQKLWREKKKMEDDKLIWGYTAVVDDTKRGSSFFVLLFKSRVITEGLAKMAINRVKKTEYRSDGVQVLDVVLVNGPYDCVLFFSAPDRMTARQYVENLKKLFEDTLQDRPVLLDVTFPVYLSGKPNPEMERFMELVP